MINEKLVKGTRICGRTIINIALWLLSITCIFPIVWMIYSSLKSQKEFAIDIISLYSFALQIPRQNIYLLFLPCGNADSDLRVAYSDFP